MNKKKIAILVVVFMVFALAIIVFAYLKDNDNKLIKKIRNSHSKYVVLKKESNLYNKNNKKIGKVLDDINLELEDININKNKYFKIKNSDYYVYYGDVNKDNKKDEYVNKYLTFNKNIVGKNIEFYKNDIAIIVINDNIDLPIEYMDENYYYVNYFNQLLSVKKSDKIKVVDSKNNDIEELKSISVINYEVINDCSEFKCVSVETVNSQIDKLKSDGFYSISLNDFKNWLNGNIRLKNRAILLTTNTNNDNVNNINNSSDIKIEILGEDLNFTDNNKVMKLEDDHSNINRYIIKKTTTIENFIKMVNGEEVPIDKEAIINNYNNEQGIAVLNYHFFYKGEEGRKICNESICFDIEKFKEHLKYLNDNGYKTLTIEEFKKWMYGELELPKKSVLLTIDDGAYGTGAHNGNLLIPALEEYNAHATLFLISGWWSADNYRSKNLDIQSHTFDMHQYGTCGSGQLVCANYEEALTDLKKSLEIVDNNTSFCFPFYNYSNTSIQAVKDAGFKIAFAGGNRKSTRKDNKYTIPRYVVYDSMSLAEFIRDIS